MRVLLGYDEIEHDRLEHDSPSRLVGGTVKWLIVSKRRDTDVLTSTWTDSEPAGTKQVERGE
jgi:hypothetical protein